MSPMSVLCPIHHESGLRSVLLLGAVHLEGVRIAEEDDGSVLIDAVSEVDALARGGRGHGWLQHCERRRRAGALQILLIFL